MPRLSGAFDNSPIAITGWPAEIADQIRYDEMVAEIAQESCMPIRLSALTADRRPITIAFGSDSLALTYKPSAINAVQEARELEEREKGRHLLAQARSLSEIIIGWDLMDDDGQALPVSEETIATFGLDVVSKLTRAILDDLLPNRTQPPASRNGSAAAADLAPVPSGT